jgi:hypothetical protein
MAAATSAFPSSAKSMALANDNGAADDANAL